MKTPSEANKNSPLQNTSLKGHLNSSDATSNQLTPKLGSLAMTTYRS